MRWVIFFFRVSVSSFSPLSLECMQYYCSLIFLFKKRKERFLSKVDFSISCSFKNVMLRSDLWKWIQKHLMFKFKNQNHYFMVKTDSLKEMQAAFYACSVSLHWILMWSREDLPLPNCRTVVSITHRLDLLTT